MAMSKKVKIEITILVIVLILITAVIYISFISPRVAKKEAFMSVGVSPETDEDSFMRELSSLKMEVLSDKAFEALRQYSSLPVNPGERGIANPFSGGAVVKGEETLE